MRLVRRELVAGIILGVVGAEWLGGGAAGTALAVPHKQYYVAPGGTNMVCATNSSQHPAGSIESVLANCVTTDNPPPWAPDSIHVAAGTYRENDTITGNVNLLGAGAGTTIVDGGHMNSVIYNHGYTVDINGMTLTNGDTLSAGGGIDNQSGTVTVTNSAITKNVDTDSNGGGIANNGTMKVVNTPVTGNEAYTGGGIENGGTMTVTNSPVIGNTADGSAGGIFNGEYESNVTPGAMLRVTNSRVGDNMAARYQGGILNLNGASVSLQNSPVGGSHPFTTTSDSSSGNYAATEVGGIGNYGSTLSITNSPVSFNGAGCVANFDPHPGNIGGIDHEYGGILTLTNSDVTGNYTSCTGQGGGIYTDGSSLTLHNVGIVRNTADGDGGGLYDTAAAEPDDSCTGLPGVAMSNVTISQNTPDNC